MEPLMGLPLAMLFSAAVFPVLPETHGTVGGFRATLRITPLDKYFSAQQSVKFQGHLWGLS